MQNTVKKLPWFMKQVGFILIITVFIQRLTHHRLVYNGITQV